MDLQTLLDSIHELSDLELAVLLSLIAKEHCLIATDDDLIDDLAGELSLIVSERFGLSYCVLDQESLQSVDRFGEAILEARGAKSRSEDDLDPTSIRSRLLSLDIRAGPMVKDEDGLDNRMIRNVIIAKGFNYAHEYVQIQAIEIINNRRFLSHTTVHIAPKTFLFLPIVTASSRYVHLTPHLNDRIFISHFHQPDDGFVNLEELDRSGSSQSSISRSINDTSLTRNQDIRRINRDVIDKLRARSDTVAVTPEVRRYLQDIVTFLRIERGIDGGMTPRATAHFVTLAKCFAPLHGMTFVTPALVMLAARKVFPHRITIAGPSRERSMQYGSDIAAVSELIRGLTPEEAIEAVLNTVRCPV